MKITNLSPKIFFNAFQSKYLTAFLNCSQQKNELSNLERSHPPYNSIISIYTYLFFKANKIIFKRENPVKINHHHLYEL